MTGRRGGRGRGRGRGRDGLVLLVAAAVGAGAGAGAGAAGGECAAEGGGGGAMAAARAVARLIPAPRRHWVGDGFHVAPIFGNAAFSEEISPWLMFDYAAPQDFPVSLDKRPGVGEHPHRGFETITIAFQGEVEHADSAGGGGVIGPGDVQWMTAGRGVVHSEFHSEAFCKRGGTFEMAQLWLNLPAAKKMSAPRYQAILAADIPEAPLPGSNGGSVRVIAGETAGARGPASTETPVELWEVKLPSVGAEAVLPVPRSHMAFVFVRKGGARVGAQGAERELGLNAAALLGDGDAVRFEARAPDTSMLVLAGAPLGEPVAARGPFVMNTERELGQAVDDFMSGRMGK